MNNSTKQAFLTLVRAGLWEHDVRLSQYNIEWSVVDRLAKEQSVVGLVTAGLEHTSDVKAPQLLLLNFIGNSLQLEQHNKAMNAFIAEQVEEMRERGIYALLVKGQGIAQCYEKPLWRCSGDVDYLLSEENYRKAIEYMKPLSSGGKEEGHYSKHWGLNVEQWYVELHGSLRTGLSSKVDREIDTAQNDVFCCGNVRSWMNGRTQVFLPAADEDVFFVFTHFIKHFYKEGGVSIKQLCDWCRLLFCYREKLDLRALESRIRKAELMTEWRAFAAVAVDFLGMPVEAMPLYSPEKKWRRKADKILSFILNGREWKKIRDTISVGRIFPLSVLRFAPGILLNVNWLKIKERMDYLGNRLPVAGLKVKKL